MTQEPTKVPLPPAAIAALAQGNKIEAIKSLRVEQHLDLKQAKDRVEDHLRDNPTTQAAYATAAERSGRQAKWWLLVAVACAVLAYVLLVKK